MLRRMTLNICAAAIAAMTMAGASPQAAAANVPVTHATTFYKSTTIDGIRIFYREAGPASAPTILLLHGLPSSSRMFDTLMPLLADRYHLVAPDYPGFGHSDAPPAEKFHYTFDNIADVIDKFTDALKLGRYALYVQDYGGPIGFRLATAHPDRVTAIVVQNAVAHLDGLDEKRWAGPRAYWADRAKYEEQYRQRLTSGDGAKARHLGTSPHPERYSPDLWDDEVAYLSRPGIAEIQAALFYDYQSNIAAFPAWQDYLRTHRPPLLVVWGKYDTTFAVAEAEAYKREVPNAEVHILEAGHFALDEAVDQIAALMRPFLARAVPRKVLVARPIATKPAG